MEEAALYLVTAHHTEIFAVLTTVPLAMDTANTAPAILAIPITLEPVEEPLPALSLDPLFGAASGSGVSDGGVLEGELSS